MATQRVNLAVNTAVNLITEPATDLSDGTTYALQNKGPGHIALSVAASAPDPLTAPAFVLLPTQTFSITIDAAEPPFSWAMSVPSNLVITEG